MVEELGFSLLAMVLRIGHNSSLHSLLSHINGHVSFFPVMSSGVDHSRAD